jgi:O-antigen ligase
VNVVYLVFLGLAWVAIECFIGGTRLIYSLPAYGILAIAAILTLASFRSKRPRPDAFCIVSTLLLGAWVLGRASHSPIPYLALPDFYMMIGCLMVYLMTAFYLHGNRGQTAMIVLLWLIAAAEVWVGILQFTKPEYQSFMLFGLIRPAGSRASGMYISPNNFAGYLVTVGIISASLGIWSRWQLWARLIAFYVAIVCMLGVAISGSRGGYFATIGSLVTLAIGCMYVIRVAEPRKFWWVAAATAGGVVVIVGVAAFLMFKSGFLAHRMQTMVAKDVRIYNWEAAIDHIRVSPWVGTGAGTHLIYGRLFRRPQIQADPVHAHCDYLELLAEYGIVGGVCMLLFLTAHVRRSLRTFSNILRERFLHTGFHRSNTFAIQFGALCAIGGLAIHSLVDFDMHIPGNALIFAFLFGIVANPGDRAEPNRALDLGLMPLGKALLPLLGLFMLWNGCRLIPSEFCAEAARRALRDKQYMQCIMFAKMGLQSPDFPAPALQAGVQPDLLDRALAWTGGNPKNPNLYFYLGGANSALASAMPNRFMRIVYFEKADAAYKSGLSVFSQDESMLVRDGEVLDGLRRFAAAEEVYQKALSLDPNLGTVHEYYENHLRAEGKIEEAAADQKVRERAGWEEIDPDQKTQVLPQ